ncbi:MAG: sensor histidine kinase [Armatimonadetes bacterium]|nr:sensor histidine kinase [Armatimonadota bacterium]
MSPPDDNLAPILFVYGLAFFTMGLAIVLQVRRDSKLPLARNLWPLAAFGFLHSGVEWLDMVAVLGSREDVLPGQVSLASARMALLVISALALAWFGATLLAQEGGRWRIFRWAPAAFVLLWAGVSLGGLLGRSVPDQTLTTWIGIWARYLLYFPGLVISALALARQAPVLRGMGMPHIAADCRRAAAAFGVNAFVAGLVVPPADFIPASIVNYRSFIAAVGLPPQLFRAAAALAIAYFVVRVLRLFDFQLSLERERFASQALQAQEEERKRVARELHDETAQLLSSLLVRLTLLDQATSLDEVRKTRAELVALATRAVEGVRRLALELRPPELDDLGLAEAIRWYVDDFAARSGISVRSHLGASTGRLAPPTELALYRIAQEALANVAKHSGARQVEVRLDQRDGVVLLLVEDDGRGFDVAATLGSKDRGVGLFGMQERVGLLEGRLRIESEPGRGTRVQVEVPVGLTRESR